MQFGGKKRTEGRDVFEWRDNSFSQLKLRRVLIYRSNNNNGSWEK
jgi:hypothetical protein